MYPKSLKTLKIMNGTRIADRKVPVINRLAGMNPGQPNEKQIPGKSNRQRAALKRDEPAGKILKNLWLLETPQSSKSGRPVPRSGKRNATPQGVVFVHLGAFWPMSRGPYPEYHLDTTKVNLPASRLRCNIDLRIRRLTRATPTGRASSPLSKEVSPHHSFHIKLRRRTLP
jgi:hypothetical protein